MNDIAPYVTREEMSAYVKQAAAAGRRCMPDPTQSNTAPPVFGAVVGRFERVAAHAVARFFEENRTQIVQVTMLRDAPAADPGPPPAEPLARELALRAAARRAQAEEQFRAARADLDVKANALAAELAAITARWREVDGAMRGAYRLRHPHADALDRLHFPVLDFAASHYDGLTSLPVAGFSGRPTPDEAEQEFAS